MVTPGNENLSSDIKVLGFVRELEMFKDSRILLSAAWIPFILKYLGSAACASQSFFKMFSQSITTFVLYIHLFMAGTEAIELPKNKWTHFHLILEIRYSFPSQATAIHLYIKLITRMWIGNLLCKQYASMYSFESLKFYYFQNATDKKTMGRFVYLSELSANTTVQQQKNIE